MLVIEWPQFLEETLPPEGRPSAITVGVFDGVHRGHKALIERVVSQKEHAVPVVVSFRQSYNKKKTGDGWEYPGDILTTRQKMAVFENLGVYITIIIEFSESFRRTSGADFLRILQEHGKMNFMAVGSNFRCGYQLDTGAAVIQKLNAALDIQTCVLQPLMEGSRPISSSHIRSAIAGGRLKEANVMLGRPFTVDLLGATVSRRAGRAVYDIAGRGGILPPAGGYRVLLLDKNLDENSAKHAFVTVEDGSIIIDENLTGAFPEYVRFKDEDYGNGEPEK
jgi:riboflavin kinase/FMN adenylyltransferase